MLVKIMPFAYRPMPVEDEKASNSYLMSVVAIIAGLPLPIVNLIATLIFYLGNRRSTYFVRWHCTQALLSQISFLLMNSVGFWWTISLITGEESPTDAYFAYLMVIILYNLIEFVTTIYSAIQTRKGKHVVWYFYGGLTDLICKK